MFLDLYFAYKTKTTTYICHLLCSSSSHVFLEMFRWVTSISSQETALATMFCLLYYILHLALLVVWTSTFCTAYRGISFQSTGHLYLLMGFCFHFLLLTIYWGLFLFVVQFCHQSSAGHMPFWALV